MLTIDLKDDNEEGPPHGVRVRIDRKECQIETSPQDMTANPIISSCLATSCTWSGRDVIVNFAELGISNEIMDDFRPTIHVEELHTPRDSGKYLLQVELVGENERLPCSLIPHDFENRKKEGGNAKDRWLYRLYRRGDDVGWRNVGLKLTDYPPGMRRMVVYSRGLGGEWRNQSTPFETSGVKFGNLKILIDMPTAAPTCSQEEHLPSAVLSILDFPRDVTTQILLRVDTRTLFTIRTNFPTLAALLDNYFWLQRCEYDGVTVPSLQLRKRMTHEGVDLDYEAVHRFRPFDWKCLDYEARDGTFMFTSVGCESESPPLFCAQHPDVSRCHVTSHRWGEKIATLRFADIGVPDKFLDFVRPNIVVREMHCTRDDSGGYYELHVQLLSASDLPGIKNASRNDVQTHVVEKHYSRAQPHDRGKWFCETIELPVLSSGVRKLGIITRGRDCIQDPSIDRMGIKFARLEMRIDLHCHPPEISAQRDSDLVTSQLALPSLKPPGLRRLRR